MRPDGPGAADLHRLALDRSDPTVLHEQVAGAIRRAISDGEAGPGQRIPYARHLAAVLGVNRNTVLRALRLLRDEGLLDMRRGRAITVIGNPHTSSLITKTREAHRPSPTIRLPARRANRPDTSTRLTPPKPSKARAPTGSERTRALATEHSATEGLSGCCSIHRTAARSGSQTLFLVRRQPFVGEFGFRGRVSPAKAPNLMRL